MRRRQRRWPCRRRQQLDNGGGGVISRANDSSSEAAAALAAPRTTAARRRRRHWPRRVNSSSTQLRSAWRRKVGGARQQPDNPASQQRSPTTWRPATRQPGEPAAIADNLAASNKHQQALEKMTDEQEYEEELADYEEQEEGSSSAAAPAEAALKSKGFAAVHAAGFQDFLLKAELLSAIRDCGFEHPSEVQQECIPQAILGMDVICQAKSGMGKTAVFVLTTLQQLDLSQRGDVLVLSMCHTRELAFQIQAEYDRFSKYMPDFKSAVFYGGVPIKENIETLKEPPHGVVGTPGRILTLIRDSHLKLDKVKHFVLDECDRMLEELDMRRDVQEIFKKTPREKQVMFFSATLSPDIRTVCKKFMQDPMEIYVDNESKLTLHGLQQYYIKLEEAQKNRKLNDLLDALEFQPGCHLRQVCPAVHGARQIAAGVQLPVHLHPLAAGHEGAVGSLQVVQGLRQAHYGRYRPVRPWHRHREGQHRHQLRHA